MSDEEISKAPAQDITSTDTDTDEVGADNTGPRVFDITPDLNIAPAKDEADNTSVLQTPVENPASINIIAKPQKVEPPTTNQTIQPDKVSTSFGPANPPAKTVGMNRINQNQSPEQINSTEPANLQEAVASIKINPDKPTISNISTKIPEKPWLPKKDSIIKPLRTYESDFAEAMAKKRITTTSAIIAEDKRKEEQVIEERKPINMSIVGEVPLAPYPENSFQTRPFPSVTNFQPRQNTPQADKPITAVPPTNPIPVPPPITVQTPFPNPITSTIQTPIPVLKTNRENNFRLPPLTPKPTPIVYQKEDFIRNAKPPISSKIEEKSNFLKNFLLIIISIVLIAGGIYAGYYLYKISPLATMLKRNPVNTNNAIPSIQDTESLFNVDSKVNIAIDNKNENQIIRQIRTEIAKEGEANKIKEIVLTKTTENITKKVTANELLSLFTIPVPELITRSLSPEWMLGVYNGIGGQKHTFIITTNNFFQNTFAGIIQWEKLMPQDLKLYTNNQNDGNFTLKGQYKDKIIKNKDVREYVLENGHINYLYSFITNDKLVITDSEEALNEIIIRLEKNAFVR